MAVSNHQTERVESINLRFATRKTFALGTPFMLSSLAVMASGVIDTAMMGRFGTLELTSVAASNVIFEICSSLVLSALMGYQILAPRFAGREDPGGQRLALFASARLAFIVAGTMTALLVVAGERLVRLIGVSPEVAAVGHDYMIARSPSLLLIVVMTLITATFNSYELPKYALIAGIIVNVGNVVFDGLLIYGPSFFPRLGAVGNGLSSTLALVIAVCWLGRAVQKQQVSQRFAAPPTHEVIDFETSPFRLSWPGMVSSALDYASIAVFFAIIAASGEANLAGGRIAFEIMVLLYAVMASFSAATRILIGKALGRKDREETRMVWLVGRAALVGFGVIVGLLLIVVRKPLAGLFSTSPEIVTPAADAVLMIGLVLPVMAWTIANSSLLRAFGKTKIDMVANLGPVILVQTPLCFLIVSILGGGIRGGFIGIVGYWVVRLAATEYLGRQCLAAQSSAS